MNEPERVALQKLGLDERLQSQLDPTQLVESSLARVIAVNKDNYLIHTGIVEIQAEITGKLMFKAESPLDHPTVGDWVYTKLLNDDTFGIIEEIAPRFSLLRRKVAGKKVELQAIAANIDTAFVMQSLDVNFNLRRLERYLAAVYEAKIDPVILLSKRDLVAQSELDAKMSEIENVAPAIPIIAFSNLDASATRPIEKRLAVGKTYCLLGPSGVGKTTLINKLLGEEMLETQAVRDKDHRGRHTTTRRHLIQLQNGAMLIDTPGMREFGNFAVESGIAATFDEIAALESACRFRDCTHTQEEGCSVLEALAKGEISQARYDNFMKLTRESAHYERSYVEKRRRDKSFGKMYKSIMKHSVKKPRS
ncbi:ribosome small subunit-dependent GTPase A [bacterium]|nr:ribosome small subunit-dependent GTPase A [bacterium]